MSEKIIQIDEPEKDSYVEAIETQFPKTVGEFKRIQQEQLETFCKKMSDYGPYNVSLGREIKTEKDILLGLTAVGVRCAEKAQRIVNLLFYNKNTPKNEPLIDSFLDMSVYGIIASIIKSGKWGK